MLPKFIVAISGLLMTTFHLFAATPVETHGAMTVSGNKIVGAIDNKPLQVAGMSLYWSTWGGEKFYNTSTVNWLAQDWKITLIRAAMGIHPNGEGDSNKGYLASPDRQKNFVKTVVDAAIANGVYVIVDWHDHDANLHVNEAKQFFGEMASTYKNTPNIIWEIWNEPENTNGSGKNSNGSTGKDSWDDIRSYANEVIPVIREHSNNIIIVGTPSWCQEVNAAAANPISGANIAYTLHFYAGSHGKWLRDRAQQALDKNIALFITEFGLTHADGGNTDKNLYYDSTKAWLDWADEKNISWANWSLVDKVEKSAALVPGASANGNWNESTLSESGRWIRDRLRSRPAIDTPDTGNTSNPADTITLPGRLEAESYVSKSDTSVLKPEQTTDAGGGENLGYAKPGCWAEYVIKLSNAEKLTAKARVATELDGGTITMKIGNTTVATWSVGSTGGWQTWTTTDISAEFDFPAGVSTVRLEWSGNGESLLNLNWIEFEKASAIRNSIKNSAHQLSRFSTRPGYMSFEVTRDIKNIMLFLPSGRVLHKGPAQRGRIELQLGTGLHLLRLESHSGMVSTIQVMGK